MSRCGTYSGTAVVKWWKFWTMEAMALRPCRTNGSVAGASPPKHGPGVQLAIKFPDGHLGVCPVGGLPWVRLGVNIRDSSVVCRVRILCVGKAYWFGTLL